MTVSTTPRSGAEFRRRFRGFTAPMALVASALLLMAGCNTTATGGEPSDGGSSAASPSSPAENIDPAVALACETFWGDPDYGNRLIRDVLDRAATATTDGTGDPYFYSLAADDITETFANTPDEARAVADALAGWFRDQAPQGATADTAKPLIDDVASLCAPSSPGATWFLQADGAAGTKPAALVCADIFDTPNTYYAFGNSNVLTSNMFRLVGLGPAWIPTERMGDVEWTRDFLATQGSLADDPAVAAAIAEVQAPLDDALAGNQNSPGVGRQLESLGQACGNAGYRAPYSLTDMDETTEGDGLA